MLVFLPVRSPRAPRPRFARTLARGVSPPAGLPAVPLAGFGGTPVDVRNPAPIAAPHSCPVSQATLTNEGLFMKIVGTGFT